MKESPKKQKGKRNLLLWLLLVILAVCVAILLFLYGQQSGYTILKPEPSQTESTTTSGEEEVSSEGEDSTSKTSSRSSRTSSCTDSQEETESSQAAESLPESMGETPTPILSQSETNSTPVDGSTSSNEDPPSNETNTQQISGLTIQWESQEQYAFALLWGEYAQQEPLFSALEEQGTPVTIYLYAAVGTDSVFWDNTYYCVLCYAGTGTMEQIYWDTALLLEEVLSQQGRWEESAYVFQNFNPANFVYGEPQELYVGRYFCSLESQQSLTQDRLEVWLLVLQGREPDYGPLLEKFYCLQGEYEGIVE